MLNSAHILPAAPHPAVWIKSGLAVLIRTKDTKRLKVFLGLADLVIWKLQVNPALNLLKSLLCTVRAVQYV